VPPEAAPRALSRPPTPPRLRVRSVGTAIVDVPIRRPHHFAALTIDHQSYVIVRVTAQDGLEGLGEGVTPGGPWWGGESVETIQLVIERYLAPLVVGEDAAEIASRQARPRPR